MTNKGKDTKKIIMEAALSEFSEMGYINSSTNTIAKIAGVSKGTVFNYFKSKERLFLECLSFAFEKYDEHLYGADDVRRKLDFFERLLYTVNVKKNFFNENKRLSRIIYHSNSLPKKPEFENILSESKKYMNLLYEKFYEEVNLDGFKEDFRNEGTLRMLVQMLGYFSGYLEGKYNNDLERAMADYSFFEDEFESFISIVKYGVCR